MTVVDAPSTEEVVVKLRLDDLHVGPSHREHGVDVNHVRTLAGLEGRWPPILVSKPDNRVIDGLHRLHAARSLGLTEIPCVYFTRRRADEFLEFVRRNTNHGLPLTLRERERAARSVLGTHENWSDRRIAEICGISAGTVSRLRSRMPLSNLTKRAENTAPPTRIGKDGRVRPVDASATRQRIAAALHENPDASLRTIAAIAEASPETVRTVRAELNHGVRPSFTSAPKTTLSQVPSLVGSQPSPTPIRPPRASPEWSVDSALRSTPQGLEFINWFVEKGIEDDWRSKAISVPLSRVYEVADEARVRAARWTAFAEALESRITSRRASSG